MRIALATLALGGLLVGLVPLTHAQEQLEPTAEQKAEAATNYREGLGLLDDGKPAEALPLFRKALELSGSPNARLMLARCLRETGAVAEAYRELEQVIADAGQRPEAKYQKTRESAENELSALEQQVSKLSISVADPPPDLRVELDGEPVDAEQLEDPLVIEPGEHELVASAEGRQTVTRRVKIEAGAIETIEITLEPPPAEKKPPPEPAPPPEPEPVPAQPDDGTLRLAGYFVAGAGVLCLGAFATTGLMAQSKYDSVYDACGGERCTESRYEDDIDSGKSLQTVANITLAVGTVGVLAGSAMILFGGPGESEQPPVSGGVLPGGGYVGYSGRF